MCISWRNTLNDNYQDSMRAHVTYVVGITTFMATNANMERVQANMRAVNSNINILINRDGGLGSGWNRV